MGKLTYKQKNLLCEQLETIISSGMSILEGLNLVSDNEDKSISSLATRICNKLDSGISLSLAVNQEEGLDEYFKKMIEIGELNGRLDVVLGELADYYERQDYLQRKVKEAITYPIILMWMMFAILLVLVTKILPIFTNIMNKMGISFTGLSLTLSKISKTLVVICLIGLGIITVLSIAYFIYIKVTKDETISEKILSKFPVSRNLYKTISISKLTYALSLFVNSGYPLEESINYVESISNDKSLNDKIKNIEKKVNNGESFIDAIMNEDIYTGNNKGMLYVGLKSGRQEETLKKLVEIYENSIIEETNSFLNIIEPIVIAILSFVVGIALVSLMLPLVRIMGSLA